VKPSRAINVHLGSDMKAQWLEYCKARGKSPGVMIKEAIQQQLNRAQPETGIIDECWNQDAANQPLKFGQVQPDTQATALPVPETPQPTTIKPNRKNKKSTVEDRLLSAMERLLEQGRNFGSVSVEQLAKEAGISRATFYLHFSDKGELVAKLTTRLTQDIVGSAGVWFQENQLSKDKVDLKTTLTGIFTTFKKHHAILEAIVSTAQHDDNVARLHEQMLTQLCAQSRRAVRASNHQQFPPGVSSDMLADTLTRVIALYCAHSIANTSDSELTELIDTFTHICRRSLF